MTRTIAGSTSFLRAGLLLLALLALAGTAWAQDDDAPDAGELQDTIDFEVEMFRVDLYRDDAGDEVERFVPVDEAVRGQEIEYRITATNDGDRIYRPFEFLATMQVPDGLRYLAGSAEDPDGPFIVEYSTDGGDTFMEAGEGDVDPGEVDTIQWVYTERFEPGEEITFSYRVTVE